MFDRKKYTMKEAKKWVKKHKSSKTHLTIVTNLALIEEMNEEFDLMKQQAIEELSGIEEEFDLFKEN
jgi:hypothetical protein